MTIRETISVRIATEIPLTVGCLVEVWQGQGERRATKGETAHRAGMELIPSEQIAQ